MSKQKTSSALALVILNGDGSVAERYDVTSDTDVDQLAKDAALAQGRPNVSAVLVDPDDTSPVAEGEDEDGNVHTSHASNGHTQGGAPLLHRRFIRAVGHVVRDHSSGALTFCPAAAPKR